nr:MAG TPA: hypothetical protein [Inoviridae sp.]
MDDKDMLRWSLIDTIWETHDSRKAGLRIAVLLCESECRKMLFALGGLMGAW